MSDDQSDFSGKPRRRAAMTPDESVAREDQDARKEKSAKKAGTKSARKKRVAAVGGDSAPDLSADGKAKPKTGRKADKVAKKATAKTERRKSLVEEGALAPSDEEKAKVRATRKAEKAAKKIKSKAERRRDATAGDSAPALSDEERAKTRAARKAEKAAKKVEAKTARRKDATAGDAAPVLSDEERAKTRAARKAEKAAKKVEAKAGRRKDAPIGDSAPALSDEEKAKTKAARKAEKAARKAEAKAGRRKSAVADDSTPALPGAEKASVRAARKGQKAARKAGAKAERRSGAKDESTSAPALSDEEKAKARAQRKAEKAAKKAETKAGRRKDTAVVASGPVLRDEEKAKAKAERKAGKAAKKAGRRNRGGDDGESEASEGRQRFERKKRRSESEDDAEDANGTRALQIALQGLNVDSAAQLRRRIEVALTAAGAPFEWAKESGKSGLSIYAFEHPPAGPEDIGSRIDDIAKDRAKFRVFIGRIGAPASDGSDPFVAENRAIAMLAADSDGAYVDVASLIRRYGVEAMLEDGQPTDAGCDLIAQAIMAIAAGGRMAKSSVPYPQRPAPADLAEARALTAADILSQLNWKDSSPPRLLRTHASKESVEAFIDSKIPLSQEQTLDLNIPVAWPSEIADRATGIQVMGLEFLSGPLDYWYNRAGNRKSDEIAEIDAFLKERGATASEILARAGEIIVDFADAHPLSNSAAWKEDAVSRRARVLALFVLCCMMASKRKVKFDEAVFLRVFGELLNLIEILRSDDFYMPGSFEGVQQDCLLIGLALTLRRTAYAERLLTDSIARLVTLQLNVGLTGEGVWRAGSFSDHCSLLSQFRIVIGDLDQADMALIEPVAAAARKMTVFAEAMLKSSGSPPAFDDSRDKSFLNKLSGTRRVLAGAGFSKSAPPRGKPMQRVTDTYVFRDAQYFASHSTQKPTPDSSLVILHAEPALAIRDNPGSIVLVFAYADADLVVRIEPPEGTKKRDKAAYRDPALRNGYRINDVGYVAGQEIKARGARLAKSWRGPGWAAAKSIDETNPAGSISRVVVHLKAQHAMVVVDELAASDSNEAAFEQFWHIAPGLTPVESGGALMRFSAAGEDGLTIAFDAQGVAAIDPEGEGGHCIRRTLHFAKGVVASLFQWTAAPAPAALKIESTTSGNWSIALSGGGFDARLSLAGDDLQYTPQSAG